MDRSKSRTDLLAAGKQRLQQYRQKKKDNKGGSSRGKSSKKSGKPQLPEPDAEADATSVTSISTGSSQSLTSSSAPENVDPPVDSSSVTMAYDTGNESELDSNAKLALQGDGVHENDSEPSAQDQGDNSQNVRVDVEKDVSLTISNSEGETTHALVSEPVAVLSPPASVATAAGESVTVEREGEKREKSLLVPEDIPNAFVVHSREDQVTDLGTMQEADGLDMKSCQSTDAIIDDPKELPLDPSQSDQSLSGIALENTRIGEATHEAENLDNPVELFSSLQPNQEQISEGVHSGLDVELHEGLNQRHTLVGSAVDDPTQELSMGASARSSDLSPILDVRSVNLLQLAEIIRGLSEEECQFLVKAREVSDIDPLTSVSVVPDHDFSEAYQRLKEELFLANLMKNIFHTELAEQLELQSESDNRHYKLIGELSQLRDSHNEVNENNQRLSEELANCRVELHNNSSKCVELQNQFNASMAEVEALSARVVELQIDFEISQKDSLDLSTELADCRSLISSLQDEKKGMKETLDLVTGEKNKLAEEKEFHLYENKKLVTELSDLKSSMERFEIENSNLIDRISLVTEESNKNTAEIQNLLHEVDRLSMDLAENKDLVASLQAENSNLNDSLALSADKIKNLEDENQSAVLENQRLSSHTVALQEQISIEEGERMRFEADLKEATLHLEQLSKENIFLNSTLDEHKTKIEESNKNIAESQNLLHEVDRLLMDLAENKDLVASLQAENSNLNDSLASSADKIKNLEDDNQSVVLENQRLSSHTVALQEQLSIEEGERMRFEADLKEATLHLEQLSKENILLNSTLDEHKTKIEEYGKKHSQPLSQPGGLGNQTHIEWDQSKGLKIAITKDHMHTCQRTDEGEPEGPVVNMPEHEVFNDSIGFVSLETCLNEVEKVLVMLEKAVNESVFSDRSGEKVSSPGVSKLIQAFESKVNEDEQEVETGDSIDVQSQSNSLIMFTKEQVGNLRKLLSKWKLDVQSAAALFKEERDGRTIGDAKYSNLEDQFAGLKQHCSDLEESNIELAVQYEIAKLHLGDIQEKKCHLEELYEALKQEDMHLKAKNNELYEKLGYCHSKISGLHTDMYDVKQSSNEMASVFGSQLENLQKEVTKRAMLLEQGWNTTIAEIVELVGRLNKSVGGTLHTAVSSDARNGLDISHQLEASVNAATEMIFDLQERLEASNSDHEIFSASYKEMTSRCDHLLGRNELAIGVLHKMYSDLKKLIMLSRGGSLNEDKIDEQSEALPDLLNYNSYETMMKNLGDVLNEKLELESVTKEMKSELIHSETELEELKLKCHGLDSVGKLVDDVAGVLNVETPSIEINKSSLSYLHSLVSMLVQKTKEAEIQNDTTKEEFGSKEMKLAELKEKLHYLDTLRLENENEIFILKQSLHQAEEALTAARSELQEKANELEHSEQRVSSIREKLGIAVAKGKGLVVQRDGLKQSLAETSSELERCLQELNLKDTRLDELETKLKTYSEAGERAEALESELSYIRNSANALRESFLLKDSMLQRIEEVLEELDLPEQFHSSDIIEKIDWLVRSVVGNSLPMNDWEQKDSAEGGSLPVNDWEQKDSAEGGSCSDAGYVVTDSWKDDSQLLPDPGDDDFRKNFEEMQSKYYGLAEQNEMLEQSLMERNSLVQRWEELVDKIDMPSHLRSMEMEDRIEWVGRALAEANHHVDSLQLKIERYESYCGLLNADLEESQRRRSALQGDIRALTSEREHLSGKMEALTHECEKLSVQTRGAELENEKLLNELSSLKDKLEQKAEIEEQMFIIDGKIKELRDLVNDALSESESENLISDGANIDALEELLRKLIENHASLSSLKPTCGVVLDGHHSQNELATLHEERSIEIRDKEEADVDRYKEDLEAALSELVHLKKEKESNLEKQISLSGEIEALSKRTEELQELLNHEEQKSASAREKLNVAVRKGKALVQQRDSLKQTIQEMSVEMEHLKSEINNRESTIAEHEHKLRQLSTYPDRLEALESESLLLKHHLEETEHHLQEKEYSLQLILNKLGEIDVGGAGHVSDPLKKLELVGKLCSDLHGALASSEQESRKSKRASELLLAELNEVQERNDSFQEELAKIATELMDLRRERDAAETAKLETLSHLEKLSALHDEEKKSHYSEIMELKSNMNQVCKGFGEVQSLLANAFFKDLESFRNVEAGLESCMKGNNAANVVDSSLSKEHDGILRRSSDNKKSFVSGDSWSALGTIDHYNENAIIDTFHLFGHQLQEFLVEVNSLKETIHIHSSVVQEQDKTLSKLMTNIQREITSQRESCENIKKELSERDLLFVALRGNIACLYESFINSVIVLENGKAELVGEEVESSDLEINKTPSFDDEKSQECIKTMADRLLLAAKGFASVKTEFLDANQKEMKATITNLQRELQEKDVQRDRICAELVKQIKDAEAAANTNSQDLQSLRIQEHNLKTRVELIEAEKKILEQRVIELQDKQGTEAELLGDKMRAQTDLLAAKDLEIEALMHALDEEETQMEELTKKNAELEKVVQHKNQEIENLESSRSKVMKKLSVTVSKFDELHHLSASLLSEVEKLQSQLPEKDAEISFLRQEVTRCTNDALLASQLGNQRSSDDVFELLMWVDTIISRDGDDDIHPDVKSDTQVHQYKEILHKKLMSLLSELENLREVAESKDAMLQAERSKVAELNLKAETLEKSLHEKASQLNLLEGVEETGKRIDTSSEITEVEPLVNEWTTTTGAFVTPQVRSLRKGNSDHVAIAVDADPGSTNRIEDEDDDKVHGFKSLTSSKIVPRFTRPVSDLIDGLWVSCDRTLMRQPVLRLGIIIYWAIMHALLAFFVV